MLRCALHDGLVVVLSTQQRLQPNPALRQVALRGIQVVLIRAGHHALGRVIAQSLHFHPPLFGAARFVEHQLVGVAGQHHCVSKEAEGAKPSSGLRW